MKIKELADVFAKDAVIFDCEPFISKDDMFNFMSKKLLEAGIVTNQEEYLKSLNYRESLGSTFMGNYIGLPHGKCTAVIKSSIAFCRCKEPFLYKSHNDEGLVKYVFMLAISGEESGNQYMHLLARLAGLLAHENFVKLLDIPKSFEELEKIIKKYEKEVSS